MSLNLIDAMDFEAGQRDYLALSICVGYPDGGEKLIHHNDQDRREQFDTAIEQGAVPVGVFFIFFDSKFGYLAGATPLVRDKVWEYVFKRETETMTTLISRDPAFRHFIAERNPRVH